MRITTIAWTAVGLVGLLAGVGVATDDPVGAVGDEFTIEVNQTFTKRPSIKLTPLTLSKKAKGPSAKAKVTDFGDGFVTFIIQKAKMEGSFTMQAKAKGIGTIDLNHTLTTVPPNVTGVGAGTAQPKDTLVINGTDFGTKKAKVFVNGSKGKVKEQTNTQITVQLHKKTPGGQADVTVTNSVGTDTMGDAVFVEIPPPPIKGGDQITASIGGKFKATGAMATGTAGAGVGVQFIGVQSKIGRGGADIRTLTVVPDIGVPIEDLQLPHTVSVGNTATFSIAKTTATLPPKVTNENYDATEFSVTITSLSGNRVQGTFSGTFQQVGGGKTLTLKNGKFVVDRTTGQP